MISKTTTRGVYGYFAPKKTVKREEQDIIEFLELSKVQIYEIISSMKTSFKAYQESSHIFGLYELIKNYDNLSDLIFEISSNVKKTMIERELKKLRNLNSSINFNSDFIQDLFSINPDFLNGIIFRLKPNKDPLLQIIIRENFNYEEENETYSHFEDNVLNVFEKYSQLALDFIILKGNIKELKTYEYDFLLES
jgi:hypothetical protein